MRLIAYISDFALPMDQARTVTNAIAELAQRKNETHDITGVMFFVNGQFVQILEGSEAPLRALLKNIEADPRHKNLTYLMDEEIQQRGFADWSMEVFHLDGRKRFDTETLRLLTNGFVESNLLRSDVLSYYYRAALDQGAG